MSIDGIKHFLRVIRVEISDYVIILIHVVFLHSIGSQMQRVVLWQT